MTLNLQNMTKEDLHEAVRSALCVAGDNLQSYGGFCLQLNKDDIENLCSSLDRIASAINNVSYSLDNVVYALSEVKPED